MRERDTKQALFSLLFAVEQAANNDALCWEVEEAFLAYEASKASVMHSPSAPTEVEPDELETLPKITWPKSKDVGRFGDMTPPGQSVLRVGLDSDNDVYVNLWDNGSHEDEFRNVSIEFCNGGGGGGKSPRTRAALINLMTAIEQDNEADPTKDWKAARTSKGAPL